MHKKIVQKLQFQEDLYHAIRTNHEPLKVTLIVFICRHTEVPLVPHVSLHRSADLLHHTWRLANEAIMLWSSFESPIPQNVYVTLMAVVSSYSPYILMVWLINLYLLK